MELWFLDTQTHVRHTHSFLPCYSTPSHEVSQVQKDAARESTSMRPVAARASVSLSSPSLPSHLTPADRRSLSHPENNREQVGHGISRLYKAFDSQQTRIDNSIASIEELSFTIDYKLSELQDHIKEARRVIGSSRPERSVSSIETEIEEAREHLQQRTRQLNHVCTRLHKLKGERVSVLDWRMTAARQKAEEFREEQRVRHILAKRLASLAIGGVVAIVLAMTFLSTVGGWIMMFGKLSEAAT